MTNIIFAGHDHHMPLSIPNPAFDHQWLSMPGYWLIVPGAFPAVAAILH
jgi:hypothetical protein